MYVEDHQKDWDIKINCVLFAYRTAFHETLKDSPFFVVYGREPRIPMDVRFLNPNKKIKKGSIEEYRRYVVSGWRRSRLMLANELMVAQAKLMSSKSNIRRIEIEFTIGEPVWLYCYFRRANEDDERISKLAYKWHGPFRIISKISNNVYELDLSNGTRSSKILVNVNRLKKYQGFWSRPEEDIDPDPHTFPNLSTDEALYYQLPRESFVSNTTRIGNDDVIINVIDKIVDKRTNKVNGRKTIQYFVLLKNGKYLWRSLDQLGSFQRAH